MTLDYKEEDVRRMRSKILTISGCLDAQNSFSIDNGTKWVGALTQAFLKLVAKSGKSIKYQRIGRFLTRKVTLNLDLPQRPVISSSRRLNNRPIILL